MRMSGCGSNVRRCARGLRHRWWILALFGAGLLEAAPAAGQGGAEEEARVLFEQGVEAASRGDYAAAITAFSRSFELFPHAATLKNLALYEDEAGRPADAFASWSLLLRQYGEQVSAQTRGEAQGRVAELDAVLATVTITANVEGARVLVDGRDVGTVPLAGALRLGPDEHVFEARREGYQDVRVKRLVGEGAVVTVELALVEQPAAPAVLRVESATSGALVSVDGGAAVAAPVERSVEPGMHEVRVEAPGFLGETRPVEIGADDRTVLVTVDLTAVAVPEPPPPAVEEEGEGFWSGPWPWVIGGIVVAGAGAATAAVLLWPDEAPASKWTLRVR